MHLVTGFGSFARRPEASKELSAACPIVALDIVAPDIVALDIEDPSSPALLVGDERDGTVAMDAKSDSQ